MLILELIACAVIGFGALSVGMIFAAHVERMIRDRARAKRIFVFVLITVLLIMAGFITFAYDSYLLVHNQF